MARYIVTLYTPENGAKSIFPFPTIKTAAQAALLIYRATAEQPTATSIDTFLLGRQASAISWSNALRTIHIEIRRD